MERLKKLMVSSNPWLRVITIYLIGFLLLIIVAITSNVLLPEGIIKNANPLWNWSVSQNLLLGTLQIFCFNLIFDVVMVLADLFAKCSRKSECYLPAGYWCLFLMFIIFGVMIGTWSFQMATTSMPFIDRMARMFNITEASGLLEMLAFCCIAGATANIAIVKSKKDGSTTSSRVRDIHLSGSEIIILIIGLCLQLTAAFIETNSIHLI